MLSLFPLYRNIHLILSFLFFICGNISAQWDKYPTYDEYLEIMNKFETDYPALCKIEELGESVAGRKLLAAKLSDNVTEDDAEPGFLYISTIHGDEICGYVLLLHLIDSLLTGYAASPRIKNLVDNIEIWICPLANPDGTYRSGNHTVQGAQRNNANNMDLDRNFPFISGNVPPPEKETHAIIDFLSTHNITMAATLHGGVQFALYPWASESKNHVDKNWFELVLKEYVDTVQANSPDGYFEDMGGYENHYKWYESHGTLLDYAPYFAHCRTIQIELSLNKVLNESELINHWNYNYRSFFNYMEQVFYGIRGIVTGSGDFLEATVCIDDHDDKSSQIYSSLPHGDYYRPIYPGTYSIIYSADDHHSKIITDIKVENNKATIVNAELINGAIYSITLTSPSGGDVLERGKSYNISYESVGEMMCTMCIDLLKGGTKVQEIVGVTNPYDYSWTVPVDLPLGSDYRIFVAAQNTIGIDLYSECGDFSIVDSTSAIENKGKKPLSPDKNFIVSYNNRNISIRYNIQHYTFVTLEAYDIKGKLIKVITDEFMQKGSYKVNWDSKRFGSGIYLLKLNIIGSVVSKRVVVIK